MLGFGAVGEFPLSAIPSGRDILRLLAYLDTLKKQMDALRPLDRSLQERIDQHFRIDWNYHSNSIEGNSYTYGETRMLLLHGLTAGGKPIKDFVEIEGHNSAILALEDFLGSDRRVTESWIRNLHSTILKSAYSVDALTPEGLPTSKVVEPGKYKRSPNHVRTAKGEIFHFAEPIDVPARMEKLVRQINDATDHPAVLAALVHYDLVRIHPFDDGNGRIARLLMNLILMRAGYPPAVIRSELKDQYYEVLQQADAGNIDSFVQYVVNQAISSAELWLRAAQGEPIDNLENEIRLFKASILRNPQLILEESSSNLHNFIDNSFAPFAERLLDAIAEFADLFDEIQASLFWKTDAGIIKSLQVYSHSSRESLQPVLDSVKESGLLARIGMQISFHGLKAKGHRRFSRKFNIDFNLLTTPQGIEGVKENATFHFNLEEGLPNDLIRTLLKEFTANLMESIRIETNN